MLNSSKFYALIQ